MEDRFITIGTLSALKGIAGNLEVFKPDVISIDIATLLRNIHNTHKKLTMDDVTLEISETVAELIEILDNGGYPKCGIHFFLVDHSKTTKTYELREVPPARRPIEDMVNYILLNRSKLFGNVLDKRTLQGSHPMEVGVCSHGDVLTWYRTQLLKFKIGARTILLSDNAIMWRGVYKIPMTIVRSFTGSFLGLKDLPEAVFGDRWSEIPFVPKTHDLLGDKKMVAPRIGVSEKKRLYDLAKSGKWKHLSLEAVNIKLKQNGFN